MQDDNQKQDKRNRDVEISNAGLAGIAGDVVDRHGSGVKEHIVGYSGVDNELGTVNERGLKQISEYHRGDPKTDPNYQTNTKQQAGFAAETKEVARSRAEEAIAGKKPTTTRTDDIIGPDGQKHHVNDQLFDITSEIDANGDPVPSSSVQMKFVGSSPEAAVDKMLSKDYQKYIDNDVKMMVPSDYFDGMQDVLDDKIASLEKQVNHLKAQGRTSQAEVKQQQLDKCKTLKKNLVKSKVSNDEAIEARNNPKLSTAKDIARVSNRAGLAQAKTGAVIGGGMSLIRHLVAVIKKEENAKEAALDVVGDTAGAAALSYATGFTGAVIKGTAQNASSEFVRNLSRTNLPAYIATSTLEVGKTLKSYFSGDIDGVQCLEQLGEKGYGMVNSALYAAIGQVAIPIPIVGALAGSMLGYALSSASYSVLTQSLKEAKIAKVERIRIEAQVEESIAMLKEYRAELEANISRYLEEAREFFDETFSKMKSSLQTGDVDGYISSTNAITRKMGKRPVYENFSQFDSMMCSDETLKF